MEDRTAVCLCFMKDDAEKMTSYIKKTYDDIDEFKTDQFTKLNIFEVNYGDLSIQEWAEREGIPYSYQWGAGDSYGSGHQHLRFDEKGKPILIEFSDEDLEIRPEYIYELLVKADAMDDMREAYLTLRSFLAPFTEDYIPLEWETQKRNKMIARTVNLISQD